MKSVVILLFAETVQVIFYAIWMYDFVFIVSMKQLIYLKKIAFIKWLMIFFTLELSIDLSLDVLANYLTVKIDESDVVFDS